MSTTSIEWTQTGGCSTMPALAQRVPTRTPQHATAPVPTPRLTAHVGLVTVGGRCAGHVMENFPEIDGVLFATIPDFPGYCIGNDGSLWSRWKKNGRNPAILSERWKRMNPSPDGDGYLGANLFRDSKPHRYKIHLLVINAFIGPRPNGLEACHNNGNASDCSIGNLRWDTHESNMRDRLAHGSDCRGEKNGKAVLTVESVRLIKASIAAGELLHRIATRFNVAPSTISGIKQRRLWQWV